MEELHVDVLEGSGWNKSSEYIGKLFNEWKNIHSRARIKQLHYSTCYVNPGQGVKQSILIEYTEES